MGGPRRAESAIGFKLMELMYRVRDLLQDPRRALDMAKLGEGMRVADYGCGPGSFTIPAALIVGDGGRVYAVDIHPLAISSVRMRAAKNGLGNVEAILVQAYDSGIEAASIDRILLIDTIHRIEDPDALFRELRRIVKPDGLLFMHKGHMSMSEQHSLVERSGLFKVAESKDLTTLAVPQA
jgi:ubiquinone/menaquinone biosynthesis C-methylase UbiE